MTTQEIANRLVEYCRNGQYKEAYNELFSDDAIAIEPDHAPNPRMQGKENLLKKIDMFQSQIEESHSSYVSDPLVASNHFSVAMGLDITMKGRGRMNMDEICLYQVKDGKIVQEQFFF